MINPFINMTTEKKVILGLSIALAVILVSMATGFYVIFKQISKKPAFAKEISQTKIYVPQPSDTVRVVIPAKVDTLTVIKEYYSKVVYRDTIFNNDTLKLVLRDTVYQNGIASRQVDYTLHLPEQKIPKHGIGAQFVYGSRNELMLMGEYQYNRMKILGGYDFGSKTPLIGVGVKLLEW